MKKNIYAFVLLIIFFGLYFFRVTTSYRMPPLYNYDADFGRDLLMMQKINQGELTLVGPQFNFSGLRLSPYHFYFFAPFLKIAKDYRFVIFANCCFFIVGFIWLFFYLDKKMGKKNAFLAVIWLSTTPYLLLAARSPGNAFSYLILLVVYLFYLFFQTEFSLRKSLVLGFLSGIMINYHPVSTPVVLLSFIASLFLVKKNNFKEKILWLFFFFFSLGITFVPFLLFELRHNFVITKSVLAGGNHTFPGLKSIWSINSVSFSFIRTGFLGLLFFLFLLLLRFFNKKYAVWFLVCFISFLTLVLYGQPVAHYLFPTIILMQISLIFFLSKSEHFRTVLLLFILVNLFFFPKSLYQKARNLAEIESNLKKAISKGIIPRKNLNVILLNQTHLSVVGYEYRYLLTKYGFFLDDEFSYNVSKFLLLVSEKGQVDWKKYSSWETKEFGEKKLRKQFCQESYCYFIFEKVSL